MKHLAERESTVEQTGAHRVAGLCFQGGDRLSDTANLLGQELEHEHGDLVAEQRVDASLKPQSNGNRQHITRRGASQALVEPMKLQHRNGCVILGIAENTRETRAISPDLLGFL